MTEPTFNISAEMQSVKVVGDILYVGSKYNTVKDLVIQFKKCMFNDLMTYSYVGLIDNTEASVRLAPDMTDERITTTSSDNIGPIYLNSTQWVGGNHSYNGDLVIKTAETESFSFWADGVQLVDGDNKYVEDVEVRVHNILYDPDTPTMDGETPVSLDNVLLYEDVVYKIKNGSIYVYLKHTFNAETAINTYYGMQSVTQGTTMFLPEGGTGYEDFVTKGTLYIAKSAAPNFNRYVIKGATWYESAYLMPIALGLHGEIDAASYILVSTGGKLYHVLIGAETYAALEENEWHGIYSWKEAIADDENVFITESRYDTYTLLFIDCKKAYNGAVSLPAKFNQQAFTVDYLNTGITIGETVVNNNLQVTSSNAGSVILRFTL